MMNQLAVLRKLGDTALYTRRFVEGEVLRGNRQRVFEGGANLPIGGTSFKVLDGSVSVGETVLLHGQGFRVIGLEPLPPFFTESVLTTDQAKGPFRIASFHVAGVDGAAASVDGQRLGVLA